MVTQWALSSSATAVSFTQQLILPVQNTVFEELGADRVLYFIDSRQHQHLMQAWTIVRKAGYIPESVSLEHHAFGMMLGKDGKPFKTRAGGTVRLADLLDEAEVRAAQPDRILRTRTSEDEKKAIANTQLQWQRLSTQFFLSTVLLTTCSIGTTCLRSKVTQHLTCNTHTSCCFCICESWRFLWTLLKIEIKITEEKEKALIAKLLQFEEQFNLLLVKVNHIMCSYLFELAGQFSSFYEACPI
ncbi:arginine--tRNA ligase [Vibrio chagasii]|nr:arginine--tRNA ligase [Vibrio chagasii]